MKPQLYVIEGPDAAGKTTLVTNLADRTGGNTFRCTYSLRLGEAIVDYFHSVLDNAEDTLRRGRSMIIDRHWPSEWVYGGVHGRPTLTSHDASFLDERVKKLGGVYVFCSDDVRTQVIRHGQMKDPQHPYADDVYTRICGGYFTWWNAMLGTTPVYRYQLLLDGQDLQKFTHDLESDTNDRLYFPAEILPVAIDTLDHYRPTPP